MSTLFLPINTPAPDLTLTDIVTKRRVPLADRQGTPLLLLFVDQNTRNQARDIVMNLRLKHRDHEQLLIASVLDLHIVPRLLRGTVKGVIKSAYKQAIREIPVGFDPADHLILLVDWKGEVNKAYRIPDVSNHPALVFIDGNGRIHTTYHGTKPVAAALTTANKLLSP